MVRGCCSTPTAWWRAATADGTFFPLEDSAETLSTDDFGTALDGLLGEVADHVGERVNDDVALVLVERQNGTRPAG